ncbi:MAG: hypothetical protein HY301_12580 [Verrucomicrobia bacterium]|nr:hypothetical protein [Verrucomicrobiota bacterium]
MNRVRLFILFAILAFSCGQSSGGSKADPADWILWRAAPIAFPDSITPQVPELMQGEAAIDFHKDGSDLTIIMPDGLGDDYDAKALDWAKRFIVDKVKKARVTMAAKVGEEDLRHHLLVLGTVKNNAFAQRVLGDGAATFLNGIRPSGYRIAAAAHPVRKDRRVILALGADMKGAYSAGAVLCHAIHPNKDGVNTLANWPAKIPGGCFWLPFEAKASPPEQEFERTAFPNPPPPRPLVPFGVRVWGSPMPTLASYQRLVRALAATGMNCIVVQSGGWVDLPDAPEVFRKALDIAWQEGIYTCLYVGNEEAAHQSAPLTANHKALILATKDHPGLLAFHLYNQLGTKDSPEQYRDLESQVRWINSLTDKPTSIEVVWGHNSVAIPADKQKLMRDLKSWGLDIISTDYAPIGGWSEKPYLPRWEQKILELRPFEEKTEVLLQAHSPFLGATVPSAAQVRNQFWWALAGGVHGFFVEVGYLHTHFSMRGLLSWDFKPLPDDRFDAVKEIAADSQRMAEFITEAKILTANEAAATGIRFTGENKRLHLRLRTKPDGTVFALLINEDLAKSASARLTVAGGKTFDVNDVLAPKSRGQLDAARKMAVTAPPGGAVCLKLKPIRQ